ncbi:MAG: hypothetical protein ABWY19_03110 [Marmoricola sp.]
MRHPRLLHAAIACLTVTLALGLAGCGSDQSSGGKPDAAPSASPEPPIDTTRTFTLAELNAALPTARDIDGARRVESRCRFGKVTDDCAQVKETTYSKIVFSTNHKPNLGTDNHRKPYWRSEEFSVSVDQYVSAAAAAKGMVQQYDNVKAYQGSYSTKAVKVKDGQTWGARGVGDVAREPFLGLRGVEADVRLSDVDLDGKVSKKIQIAILVVSWGRYRVVTRVIFFDAHHDPGDARKAVAKLVEDYLARLDKSA